MGRDPIVKGWRGASFAGVDFAKRVTSWNDNRARAGTIHKYNKRDGGEGEDMGREPFRSTMHLAFIGQNWRPDFLKLQAAIDDSPIDTFVHPVYGAMTAWCKMSTGGMDVENSPNLYDVTLEFEESQVDTKAKDDAATASAQGPAAKQQAVTGAAAALLDYAPLFPTAAAALQTLSDTAANYAAAAVASAQALTPDPTLPQQLASVLTASNAAQAALALDPAAAAGVVDPAYGAVELLYDACVQVDDAVRALRPTLSIFIVPETMHITALSLLFYGPIDGPAREAEILANNAGVLYDPAMIPAGLALLMAPPTV